MYTTFIISIASSALLAISEILPYISKIKSNGILQCLHDILIRKHKQETDLQHEPTFFLSSDAESPNHDVVPILKSIEKQISALSKLETTICISYANDEERDRASSPIKITIQR
jgi:hypothetical protein